VAENQRKINAAFVSQAQGDISQKLQKLEGFAGMNASQLLEVAIKVFVDRDQEAKWKADKKMKRKMDLHAAALAKQSGRPLCAGHGRGRSNPCGWQSVPLECPHSREELRQGQCAYCHQERHWRNEGPQWPRDPQKAPPDQRQKPSS
jgi:hypothetical protein